MLFRRDCMSVDCAGCFGRVYAFSEKRGEEGRKIRNFFKLECMDKTVEKV